MASNPNGIMSPVSLTRTKIDDGFWTPRMEINRKKTIPHEYMQCKETGRIDAFDLDWQPGQEPTPHYFWDSDVAKWIEAASYSLATHPDPELDALIDEVIEKIATAQQPDGYLNTYFTVVEPKKRWKNLGMWHELYCAGHLMEAAVAHYEVTGKRRLLDVMCRYGDYIDQVFGPGPNKRFGAPGHQEIELALVRLYRVTGNEKYLRLSQFFLDQRGQKPSVFQRELEDLSWDDSKINRHFFVKEDRFDTSYCQDHLPVREQSEVVGHAVRAMYQYSAMTDVAMDTQDQELLAACHRLWDNVCRRRMYVTGGIGPSRHNEGFTKDYDLPNHTAYAETCATVGLIFWNHRMLHIDGNSRYGDVMERALYNGALSGVSLDGERFFYENPLASTGHHHRQEWFGCACCPPNIARLIASLGGYIYSEKENNAYIHLYISGQGEFSMPGGPVIISQKSRYPWDGEITVTINCTEPQIFGLNMRIPQWCHPLGLWINDEEFDIPPLLEKGYACISRKWQNADVVRLSLAMPIHRVRAHPNVGAAAGCVALQRGPIVYCLEQTDNPVPLHRLALPEEAGLNAVFDENLLGGVVKLQGMALLAKDNDWQDELYRFQPTQYTPYPITAIPYYAWDNREPGEMRVWIREAPILPKGVKVDRHP